MTIAASAQRRLGGRDVDPPTDVHGSQKLQALDHTPRKAPKVPVQVLSLEQLAERAAPGRRLLGLDLGTKTIGLALSDVSRTIASALSTIERVKFTLDARALLAIAAQHDVAALVIGFPVNLDGTEGPRAQSTRAFVRSLAPLTEIPIVLWDERLSTQAAERTLLEADASRKRRAEVIDKMAAAFILQGCLDRLRRLAGETPS